MKKSSKALSFSLVLFIILFLVVIFWKGSKSTAFRQEGVSQSEKISHLQNQLKKLKGLNFSLDILKSQVFKKLNLSNGWRLSSEVKVGNSVPFGK